MLLYVYSTGHNAWRSGSQNAGGLISSRVHHQSFLQVVPRVLPHTFRDCLYVILDIFSWIENSFLGLSLEEIRHLSCQILFFCFIVIWDLRFLTFTILCLPDGDFIVQIIQEALIDIFSIFILLDFDFNFIRRLLKVKF